VKILILLLALSFAVAQIDTVESLSFMPLKIGNRYQYQVQTDAVNNLEYFLTIEITDTVAQPNGLVYYEFSPWFLPQYRFVRIDTGDLAIKLYDQNNDCYLNEYFWAYLGSRDINAVSTSLFADSILYPVSQNCIGESIRYRPFNDHTNLDLQTPTIDVSYPLSNFATMSQNIGLTFIRRYWHWSDWDELTINYALVDGIEYGDYAHEPELYLPLKTGNKWQYHVVISDLDSVISDDYTTMTVTGDTILPNGETYWIIENSVLLGNFIRQDTVNNRLLSYVPGQGCTNDEWDFLKFTLVDSLEWDDCLFGTTLVERGVIEPFQYQGNRPSIWLCPNGLEVCFTFVEQFGLFEIYSGFPGINRSTLIACVIDSVQYGEFIVSTHNSEPLLPKDITLYQNHPNPFNPVTTIQYELPKRSDVQINIYDLLGKKVTTLVSETQDAGFKSVQWDATSVPSGIYFYRLEAGNQTITRKLVVLK